MIDNDLTGLFSPQSIAVIGVSANPEKVGAIVLKNIIVSGFRGRIYPVNPNVSAVSKMKFYPDVESLPEVPDLAVIAVPAEVVLTVLNQIGEKGIKNVVVFSAGFKEAGVDGENLEKQLIEIANKYNLRILGPNCLGFANNGKKLNVTFGQVTTTTGNLRIVSQSGALAASMFDWCSATGMGFDQLVTIGNKAIVNENTILKHWLLTQINEQNLVQTGLSKYIPVGLYMESISDGREFVKTVRQISMDNPVFVLKPGKSKAATKAMQSHTGSIAGEDNVLDAALRQTGVIRCSELGDFFDLARALAWENVPEGPGVAVISNAGGPAVLSTDTISQTELVLTEFSPETQQKLEKCLPRMANFQNPVDLLGDALAKRFGEALEIVLSEKTVNGVIVILTPQLMTQIEMTAEIISQLSLKYSQPILCSFVGGGQTTEGEKILNQNRIPSFAFPERAIRTMAMMWQWQKWRKEQSVLSKSETLSDRPDLVTVKEIIKSVLGDNRLTLNNIEANRMMMAANIPTPQTLEVADINQAEDFAEKVGKPVVLKLSSPGLLHKSDVGGVVTQIYDSDQLKMAWGRLGRKIEQLAPEVEDIKVQVQKEIVGGVEVIIGVKKDPNFGLVMLFGAGGQLAELINDRNLHLLPINMAEAKNLIMNSKVYKLLNGYRGEMPYKLDELYKTMLALANLAESCDDIEEIEINPVKVTLSGVYALDAKVILKKKNEILTGGPQFKKARVKSHQLLNGKIHHFILETDVPFQFIGGQYISVKVAADRINSYSVAGRVGSNQFELLIDVSPGGIGSKYFEKLTDGEEINYIGPFGTFILKPDDGTEEMIFMGTGSGLAPLKSMIEEVLVVKKIQKPIRLYFGLRFEEDIFWKENFEKLEKDFPNFKFRLCLSKPGPNWTGLTGHITDVIKNDYQTADKCSVYLCGNKPMMEEAKKVFEELGCDSDKIYQEQFY